MVCHGSQSWNSFSETPLHWTDSIQLKYYLSDGDHSKPYCYILAWNERKFWRR